jgi:hypothetical protein
MSVYELIRAPENEGEFPWPEDARCYVVDDAAGSIWWDTAAGARPLTKTEARAVLTLYRAERANLFAATGRFTILGLDQNGRPIIFDRSRTRHPAAMDGE